MNDTPSPTPPEKAETAKEAAAVRRRWITLAEVLTVIAVVISALTLWNNWSERRETEASEAAQSRRASSRAATLVLSVAEARDDRLTLKAVSDEQSVQSQTIAFPSDLAVSPATTTGEPRIEAGWFQGALKKAREKAGLPDDSRGDERLPVMITTRFIVDGEAHEDRAIYDIGYSVTGRWLAGHSVTLRGISLAQRVSKANAQAKLDGRWRALLPPARAR